MLGLQPGTDIAFNFNARPSQVHLYYLIGFVSGRVSHFSHMTSLICPLHLVFVWTRHKLVCAKHSRTPPPLLEHVSSHPRLISDILATVFSDPARWAPKPWLAEPENLLQLNLYLAQSLA